MSGLLGEADAVALSRQAAQMANVETATPRVDVHDHVPHVTGEWPHWYVKRELDGWHPHLLTYDPVHGVHDTQHVDPTEEDAWTWLERAVEVIG